MNYSDSYTGLMCPSIKDFPLGNHPDQNEFINDDSDVGLMCPSMKEFLKHFKYNCARAYNPELDKHPDQNEFINDDTRRNSLTPIVQVV
ncbi:hypothetical protein Smp_156830 [Schistosoma mansoni]|uniref:hypothetical protein n=1 Tax=Schistosoma mansoni TaxID=6183 RepID=UPI00022C82FC|nr:hypothetical protein Smp_156830 [Schistosoma mansoni]|eukprot:XP_018644286.1 hypothetical protein Smp_156830 [Schistosoma mansoni]